jgi:hypothetical protein
MCPYLLRLVQCNSGQQTVGLAMQQLDTMIEVKHPAYRHLDRAVHIHTRNVIQAMESRVREMCVCGWQHRAALAKHMEDVINPFYVQVVTILGRYV